MTNSACGLLNRENIIIIIKRSTHLPPTLLLISSTEGENIKKHDTRRVLWRFSFADAPYYYILLSFSGVALVLFGFRLLDSLDPRPFVPSFFDVEAPR